jgi:uncharacterized protein (TIGR03790 family)
MATGFLFFALSLIATDNALATLEPDEVLVIANSRASNSVDLAKYYMSKRGIPVENLIKLKVTDKELCSREDYDRKVARPVREWLKNNRSKKGHMIRCLLVMYGMPLKVLPTAMTRQEKKQYDQLKKEKSQIWTTLKATPENKEKDPALEQRLTRINEELGELGRNSEKSALDSELALVDADEYPLRGWQMNPSFIGYRGRNVENTPTMSYMVARLDGPDPESVKKIIDESLVAEERGLKGSACFDARWPRPGSDEARALKGYQFYDNSIYQAADQVKKSDVMNVFINDVPQLFQPGECPDAALYVGWYRRANYYDAFEWQQGAVGYHIASSECGTLKSKTFKGWCLGMLRDGAAAVIGPTDEPYVQAFPIPAMFFSLLVEGQYTLAECYALSVPFRSWRMVLVGDPLYRPFNVKRAIDRQ